VRCVGDAWIRWHLRKEHAAGRLRGPVIFVGHSCGGRYALYTAHRLATVGIHVDLLICVDVAWPYDVAANVTHAAHLYRTRWRLYPARPLQPAPGSTAHIDNIDLDGPASPICPTGLCHLNITGSQALQDWIVRRISELVTGPLPKHR
jgi:pimeloyl-ACP methyl ester carboxylesterase